MMEIEHRESGRGGKFTLKDGGCRIGELTYVRVDDRHVIDHTWVDPERRGAGAAGRLMDAVVAMARAEGWKLGATCSYAQWSFDAHPDWIDVMG